MGNFQKQKNPTCWVQSPQSSTGRDKCNTFQTHSIATNPNLCRKGPNGSRSGSRMWAATVSFAWICTAQCLKSWMQTSKTDRGPARLQNGTETSGLFARVFGSQMHLARSTSSAHTAVDDRNTTCTISTLALLKLTQWQVYLKEMRGEKK